ncbi:hypothetical protein MauCBS54593_002361 [Microsporum audouinii]
MSSVKELNDAVRMDDIIRVSTYHRRDFDLAVIRLNPRGHEAVRGSMAHPFNHAAITTLGRMQILPVEILHEILLLLDMRSFFVFRQVNLRARQIASTVPGYQPLITHALEAICVILRTKISAWYTLKDIFNVLCTRDCLHCDSFGGFVFLPSLERCCFRCLTSSPRFRVLPAVEIGKLLSMSRAHLRRSVPLLHTISGIYSMAETSRQRRMYIVAEKQIAKAFTFPGTSMSAAVTARSNRAHAVLRYMAGTTLPYVDIASGDVQHGLCCAGCQIVLEGDTVSNPTEAFAMRDRVYSNTGFLDHFRLCPEAQKLWKHSKEGKVAVSLPTFVIRGGYFNERDVVMSFSKRKYSDLS